MRAVDRKRKNIFLALHARNTEISVSWVFAERPELRQDLLASLLVQIHAGSKKVIVEYKVSQNWYTRKLPRSCPFVAVFVMTGA